MQGRALFEIPVFHSTTEFKKNFEGFSCIILGSIVSGCLFLPICAGMKISCKKTSHYYAHQGMTLKLLTLALPPTPTPPTPDLNNGRVKWNGEVYFTQYHRGVQFNTDIITFIPGGGGVWGYFLIRG